MEITEVRHFWDFEKANYINFFSNDYFIDSSILFIRLTSLREEINNLLNVNSVYISELHIQQLDYWIDRKKMKLLNSIIMVELLYF